MDSFKKILLPIILTMIFIIAAGIFYRKNQGLSPLPSYSKNTPAVQETKNVTIGNAVIKVEIADSDIKRQKGLSGRTSLEKDGGMLFVITDNKSTPTFWMKDMKIAIDIIWLKNGKIIQIDKNVAPPTAGTSDKNLKLYSPKTAVDYVLEVNFGYSDLNNIKVGDTVLID